MISHFLMLVGCEAGSRKHKIAYYIICKSNLENVLCWMVAVPLIFGMIARVMYGRCPPRANFWDSMICNSEAEANALPQDVVMLLFLQPVAVFVLFKGVYKETIFLTLLMASATTLGCIAYLGAWNQIWAWIIPTIKSFMISFELERSKIETFLQSRKALSEERRKRKVVEEERQEQERLRAELEANEAHQAHLRAERRKALLALPVHNALVAFSDARTVRAALGGRSASPKPLQRPRYDPANIEAINCEWALSVERTPPETDDGGVSAVSEVLAAIENHCNTLARADFDGRTAFELALFLDCLDLRVIGRILAHCLPVEAATGAPVPATKHGFAWHRAVQEDRCARAVAGTLQSWPRLAEALAASEDSQGRPAINNASAQCKHALLESIYLFRRYEIQTLTQPHHQSATCVVHLGIDHGDGGRLVALKFMRLRDQFLRELSARREGGFSAEFVVGALRGHDGVSDATFLAEARRKGLGETPYCVVMEAGSRSLADIVIKEHLTGDWNRIRALSIQVLLCHST